MRQEIPAHPSIVLMRPDFGEPRIDQATPATSGSTNSGIRLTAATKPRHGVLVRTTIQEKVSPISTASAAASVAQNAASGEPSGRTGKRRMGGIWILRDAHTPARSSPRRPMRAGEQKPPRRSLRRLTERHHEEANVLGRPGSDLLFQV